MYGDGRIQTVANRPRVVIEKIALGRPFNRQGRQWCYRAVAADHRM